MKVGIVCPYSLAAPGGVQFHIRDLAAWLRTKGHDVSVLAPGEEDDDGSEHLTTTGGSVPIPYNGSVARLSFGPVVAARVARWLQAGAFDVLHIHEPLTPSTGMIALWYAQMPVVATFHSNQSRSRAMWSLRAVLQPMLDKIVAPIAVSQEARRTIVEHLGASPVIIPNGVDLAAFDVAPREQWAGARHTGNRAEPVICFLGRLDEPRKGLPVLAGAVGPILERYPRARFLIAGRGAASAERKALARFGDRVEFLGGVSDADKAAMLASADLYVAPQTGGESFGIVLVEAMAAGAHVVASDIQAFRDVLDQGGAGDLFATRDASALAATVCAALDRSPADAAAIARHAALWRGQYDWSSVGRRVLETYEYAAATGRRVRA